MIKECEVMNGDKKRALKGVIVVSISLVILASMIAPTITQGDSMAIESENDNNDYIARDSIYINGDADFAEQAAAEGWPGDGSKEEPYVMSRYIIRYASIENTTVHFKLTDNHFYDSFFGIHLVDVQNGVISGNIISEKKGLLVSEDNNVDINTVEPDRIYDHNIESTRSEEIFPLISLRRSDSNIIVDNHISHGDIGLKLLYSNNNTIANNTVSNCGVGMVILFDSNKNTIANNTVLDNGVIGIDISFDSNKNTIVNNTVSGHVAVGISLSRNSDSHTVANNTISNNRRGITSGGSNNVISGNILLANTEWGIYASGDDNLFYLNRFIDNEGQAYDSGTNRWDNGDPAEGGDGGNYWSDYEGEDRGDGIGDTPYDIEGSDNQDNYPWIIQQPDDDDGVLSDYLLPILIVVIAIVSILVVVTMARKSGSN